MNQDVVPFGTQAALTAQSQAARLRWVHGALAVALRQAIHLGGRTPTSDRGRELFSRLRQAIAPVQPDRPLDEDVRRAADLLDEMARLHQSGLHDYADHPFESTPRQRREPLRHNPSQDAGRR